MWDWLLASFKADTVEWVGIGVALLLSVVFWRWVRMLLKWLWIVFSWPFRQIGKLRITTASRVIPRQRDVVIPARWTVLESNSANGVYGLKNTSIGSLATRVHLEVGDGDVRLVSGAVWPSIPGGEIGPFEMQMPPGIRTFGITFLVVWNDANGFTKTDEFTIGGI